MAPFRELLYWSKPWKPASITAEDLSSQRSRVLQLVGYSFAGLLESCFTLLKVAGLSIN